MKRITKIIYVYEDGTTGEVDIQPYPRTAPSTIPGWDPSTPYGPIKRNCPKCGIGLSDVMGYCCPQPNCPTGLGGVQC